jgi:hypothetical protein
VLELKEQLVALTNIPTDRQRLIFRGAVLQDTQGLASARTLTFYQASTACLAQDRSRVHEEALAFYSCEGFNKIFLS